MTISVFQNIAKDIGNLPSQSRTNQLVNDPFVLDESLRDVATRFLVCLTPESIRELTDLQIPHSSELRSQLLFHVYLEKLVPLPFSLLSQLLTICQTSSDPTVSQLKPLLKEACFRSEILRYQELVDPLELWDLREKLKDREPETKERLLRPLLKHLALLLQVHYSKEAYVKYKELIKTLTNNMKSFSSHFETLDEEVFQYCQNLVSKFSPFAQEEAQFHEIKQQMASLLQLLELSKRKRTWTDTQAAPIGSPVASKKLKVQPDFQNLPRLKYGAVLARGPYYLCLKEPNTELEAIDVDIREVFEEEEKKSVEEWQPFTGYSATFSDLEENYTFRLYEAVKAPSSLYSLEEWINYLEAQPIPCGYAIVTKKRCDFQIKHLFVHKKHLMEPALASVLERIAMINEVEAIKNKKDRSGLLDQLQVSVSINLLKKKDQTQKVPDDLLAVYRRFGFKNETADPYLLSTELLVTPPDPLLLECVAFP